MKKWAFAAPTRRAVTRAIVDRECIMVEISVVEVACKSWFKFSKDWLRTLRLLSPAVKYSGFVGRYGS